MERHMTEELHKITYSPTFTDQLTREEFDKLPDGTIIATALGNQYILAGGRGLYTTLDRAGQTVRWVEFGDDDLAGMTVVSTPAPPPARQIGGIS